MDVDRSWDELTGARKTRMALWLRTVGSSASVARAEIALGEVPEYLALARTWDRMTPARRRRRLDDLEAMFRAAAYATRPFCIRCGACCTNAGPTLYPGDEGVLHQGIVRVENLVTTRVGEMVFSHWKGRAVAAERERVAVAADAEGGCPFWRRHERRCAIYDLRPAQCRAQKCWDTGDADRLMRWPGLTRRDLLEEADPLREVLDDHDRGCAPADLRERLERAARGDEEARAEAVALITADRAIRRDLVRGDRAPMEALPFLLGRPLEMMAPAWGFAVESGWGGRVQLRPLPRR